MEQLKKVILTLGNHLKNLFCTFYKESCSVYGDGENATFFFKLLGKFGIKGSTSYIYPSKYHVIIMEDDEYALEFLKQQQYKLEGKKKF